MIRNLRAKNIRRLLLLLSLIFPIVYLCGGLFFGLAGAHGEQIYAEPVYTQEYIEVDEVSIDGDYKVTVNNILPALENYSDITITFEYTFNSVNQNRVIFFTTSNLRYFSSFGTNTYYLGTYNIDTLAYTENYKPWVFYSTEVIKPFIEFLKLKNCDYILERLQLVPTEVIPENNSAYTDFIFTQPFAKNNFISTLGRDLVDGSTKGFNPMNELFRAINTNVMHFDDLDSLAMFGLGYVYYAVNVLIIYEVIVLVAWLLLIPVKVMDGFHKEDNRNDS